MDVIRDFLGVILAGVAAVVWFVRLEAQGRANASEVKRIWQQRKEDREVLKDSTARMDRRLDEISSDIKEILKGMNR